MDILQSKGTFTVKHDGELKTYTDYYDIPQDIQTVVSFKPNPIPPGPNGHTLSEHAELAKWNDKMTDLMNRSSDTPPATREGDDDVPHCSAMVRDEHSPDVFLNNIPWSRQGDNNTPHLLDGDPCPTHAAPITTGSPTVFVNGVGAGRVGDAITACTQVAEGSPNVFCGP